MRTSRTIKQRMADHQLLANSKQEAARLGISWPDLQGRMMRVFWALQYREAGILVDELEAYDDLAIKSQAPNEHNDTNAA